MNARAKRKQNNTSKNKNKRRSTSDIYSKTTKRFPHSLLSVQKASDLLATFKRWPPCNEATNRTLSLA